MDEVPIQKRWSLMKMPASEFLLPVSSLHGACCLSQRPPNAWYPKRWLCMGNLSQSTHPECSHLWHVQPLQPHSCIYPVSGTFLTSDLQAPRPEAWEELPQAVAELLLYYQPPVVPSPELPGLVGQCSTCIPCFLFPLPLPHIFFGNLHTTPRAVNRFFKTFITILTFASFAQLLLSNQSPYLGTRDRQNWPTPISFRVSPVTLALWTQFRPLSLNSEG